MWTSGQIDSRRFHPAARLARALRLARDLALEFSIDPNPSDVPARRLDPRVRLTRGAIHRDIVARGSPLPEYRLPEGAEKGTHADRRLTSTRSASAMKPLLHNLTYTTGRQCSENRSKPYSPGPRPRHHQSIRAHGSSSSCAALRQAAGSPAVRGARPGEPGTAPSDGMTGVVRHVARLRDESGRAI